jgi:DNA-directed RNA polymerase sigma subunit (sigma70/sigma32)
MKHKRNRSNASAFPADFAMEQRTGSSRPPALARTRPHTEGQPASGNGKPSLGNSAKEGTVPKGAKERVKADADKPVEPRRRGSASNGGDSAIKLYLREIAKIKPLTPRTEIELTSRIQKGDPKAREKMIKANLGLVVQIARNYEAIGAPLLDLISEGNMGLLKAVERFNPAKGAKLSTCGSRWIHRSIRRALGMGEIPRG